MSKSNASAKNRRAFISQPPNPAMNLQSTQTPIQQPGTNDVPINQTSGLTLQQVISVFDKRLIQLENFMKESSKTVKFNDDADGEQDNHISDILSEFNSRFDIFAEEIGSLKEIVLKLQSFTMDVNKMLLEERNNGLLMVSDGNQENNDTEVISNENENIVTSTELNDSVTDNNLESQTPELPTLTSNRKNRKNQLF